MNRQTNITATVFGGAGDHERSAYDGRLLGGSELYCALPFRFPGKRPKVRVFHGDKQVETAIEDVGPWNEHDPYWAYGTRPQAESGHDSRGRHTNLAGIDLSPAAARVLGIDGKGWVDWEFVEDAHPSVPDAPAPNPLMTTPETAVVPKPAAEPARAALTKQNWPRENTHDLVAFYGNPSANLKEWEAENLVRVPVPWQMKFEGTPITGILIHKKCAASLKRVLDAAWEHVGHDQGKIDACHLDTFDGSFNYRTIRGSSALSMHAYGCALDIAAKWNDLGVEWRDGRGMMPMWFVDLFHAEGWSWGGRYGGRKDCMHFEATNLGQ